MIGDQREAFFLALEFMRHKILFRSLPWTNQGKIEAVTRVRRLLAEGSIVLPPEREKLKRELLNYAERVTSSGTITYGARGAGHDDEAALLITAALAELERMIPGSTMYPPNTRHESSGR